jgi:hypothetical protein
MGCRPLCGGGGRGLEDFSICVRKSSSYLKYYRGMAACVTRSEFFYSALRQVILQIYKETKHLMQIDPSRSFLIVRLGLAETHSTVAKIL